MSELSDKQKARESVQSSYFNIELYLVSEDYDTQKVLSECEEFDQYAYAVHDKDVDEDGFLKKPHVHIVLRNLTDDGKPSSTTVGAVARRLGIGSQWVQAGRSNDDDGSNKKSGFKGSIRYLIHDTKKARAAGKFLYDRSIIKSNLNLDNIFGESFSMAENIMQYIFECHPRTFSALASWCLQNGCWKELRRSQYMFRVIVEEVRKGEV